MCMLFKKILTQIIFLLRENKRAMLLGFYTIEGFIFYTHGYGIIPYTHTFLTFANREGVQHSVIASLSRLGMGFQFMCILLLI